MQALLQTFHIAGSASQVAGHQPQDSSAVTPLPEDPTLGTLESLTAQLIQPLSALEQRVEVVTQKLTQYTSNIKHGVC